MALYALGDQVPVIDPSAFVHPDAVVIGSVTIGAESSVWPSAVLRGDDGGIEVGERTSIQDGAVLHTTVGRPTVIGDDCTVGHLAHLEGCTVENFSLIGTSSVVLPGAVVGPQALVAAGAVVLEGTVVPVGAVAMGVPAKIREGIADSDELARSAATYVARTRRFREELRRID